MNPFLSMFITLTLVALIVAALCESMAKIDRKERKLRRAKMRAMRKAGYVSKNVTLVSVRREPQTLQFDIDPCDQSDYNPQE